MTTLISDQPPAPTTVQGAIFVLSQLARDAELHMQADWAPKVMHLCLEFFAEELRVEPAAPLRPFEVRIAEREARNSSIPAVLETFADLNETEKVKARALMEWVSAGEDPATDPRKTDPWWIARLAAAH